MTATILIADDDPVQRRLLEATVRRFGYETEVVDGGAAALARLEDPGARPVDLLICDLVMPQVDGLAVLRRMREAKISVPAIVRSKGQEPELLNLFPLTSPKDAAARGPLTK